MKGGLPQCHWKMCLALWKCPLYSSLYFYYNIYFDVCKSWQNLKEPTSGSQDFSLFSYIYFLMDLAKVTNLGCDVTYSKIQISLLLLLLLLLLTLLLLVAIYRLLLFTEGWARKNWCFQIVVLEKTLRVCWTARRSNQSILKEINPEYSLEGLMLKLKLQYISHLMLRADILEKTLMLRKTEGKRRTGRQKMRRLDSTANSMDMKLSKLPERVENRAVCCAAGHGVTKSQTRLSDWITTIYKLLIVFLCSMFSILYT